MYLWARGLSLRKFAGLSFTKQEKKPEKNKCEGGFEKEQKPPRPHPPREKKREKKGGYDNTTRGAFFFLVGAAQNGRGQDDVSNKRI